MSGLQTPEQTVAWDLRGAWAAGRVVVLVLSERCAMRRLEGKVERVSGTGAFVVLNGWHIPTADVLAVRSPHFSQALEMAA